MKIKVSVDLEDILESFGGDSVRDAVVNAIKSEVMKEIKKHPEYRSYIKKQAELAVAHLTA
jgi:hypothetical protein